MTGKCKLFLEPENTLEQVFSVSVSKILAAASPHLKSQPDGARVAGV